MHITYSVVANNYKQAYKNFLSKYTQLLDSVQSYVHMHTLPKQDVLSHSQTKALSWFQSKCEQKCVFSQLFHTYHSEAVVVRVRQGRGTRLASRFSLPLLPPLLQSPSVMIVSSE